MKSYIAGSASNRYGIYQEFHLRFRCGHSCLSSFLLYKDFQISSDFLFTNKNKSMIQYV